MPACLFNQKHIWCSQFLACLLLPAVGIGSIFFYGKFPYSYTFNLLAGSPSCQDDWEPLFVVALDMCLLCVILHEGFLLYMFWCCHMLIQYPLPVVVALVVIERQKMLGQSATACLDWCRYKVSVISICCLAKQVYGLAALSLLPLHCDCRWIVYVILITYHIQCAAPAFQWQHSARSCFPWTALFVSHE